MKKIIALTFLLFLPVLADPGCVRQIRINVEAVQDLHTYSEGLAAYKIDGRWGYMNDHGQAAIPPQFADARLFSQGLAAVKLVSKWGFVDHKGEYVINPKYQDALPFSEDLAPVQRDGKWGYIDVHNRLSIECQFDEALQFSEGLAAVRMGTRWGFINNTGRYVINPKYSEVGNFAGGLAPVKTDRSDDSWGYINQRGHMKIRVQFDDAREFDRHTGLAPVLIDTLWAYIDTHGRIKINPQFEDARPFMRGLGAAKKSGKWGFLNSSGSWSVPNRFSAVCDFHDNLALVNEGTVRYYIDKSGHRAGIGRRIVGDLSPEAGFIEVEPVRFSFQNKKLTLPYTSSRARIFYSFHPADENAKGKPLFVFFNGGPGAGTSDGLLSFNTSPKTMDPNIAGDKGIADNPYSWTKLGNLLFVDAPCTGFSYNLLDRPVTWGNVQREFDAQNFNPFIDASQLVRVLIRFLAKHPEIQKNQVVLVGESYGGTRTTVMMNLLLFYPSYATGERIFRDKSVSEEIQRHYNIVFPDLAGGPCSPEKAALQFGRHILIEPQLTGAHQTKLTGEMWEKKGSVIYEIAKSSIFNYTPCDPKNTKCDPSVHALSFVGMKAFRDMYKYDENAAWSWILGLRTEWRLNHSSYLSHLTETDISAIKEMYAKNRRNAYKGLGLRDLALNALVNYLKSFIRSDPGALERMNPAMRAKISWLISNSSSSELNTAPASERGARLDSVFGSLNRYDSYITLLGMNWMAFSAFTSNSAIKKGFDIEPESPRYGRLFLQNISVIKAFITNAPYDLSVYAKALPPSFKAYSDIVRDVDVEDNSFTIHFRASTVKGSETPQSKKISFPYYRSAGHMVAMTMPEKLLSDVEDWMDE